MTDKNNIFWWAVANWNSLAKRAEHWQHTKTTPTPVSVQIAQRFNIPESDAAKIASERVEEVTEEQADKLDAMDSIIDNNNQVEDIESEVLEIFGV